ncbi:hypothetical protein Tco_0428217 [Tanacetum coccineum]
MEHEIQSYFFWENTEGFNASLDKFLEIKHAQSEEVQELLYKLFEDLQSINEELAEYIKLPSWNLPTSSYDDDDDEESSIPLRDIIMSELPPCVAIIPDSLITNSLIMEDKHLDTIPETESDEFIKEQVEFNPIHNEDLDSTIKNDHFDTESYLLESLLNRDTLMASSLKIDSLFNEFAGELITIPLRIVNREHEEYISLLERFLYDNSSPQPPEDFHVNPNTIIESLPTFPIPVEDSDSLREEIDIFPGPDDSIPPGG